MPRKGKRDGQEGAPDPPPRRSIRNKATEEPTTTAPPLKIRLLMPAQPSSIEPTQPAIAGSASSVTAPSEGTKTKGKKGRKKSKKGLPDTAAEPSNAIEVDPQEDGQNSGIPGSGGTATNKEGEENEIGVDYLWGEDDIGNPLFDHGKPSRVPSPTATTPPSEPLLRSDESDIDISSSPEVEIVKERKRKARSDSHGGKTAPSPSPAPDGGTDDELSRPLVEILAADKVKPKVVKKRMRRGTLQVGIDRGSSSEPEPEALVFMIPQAGSNTTRRLTLPANIGYSRAIIDVYSAIGCSDVKKKPELSYKLATATQKSSPISLNDEDDWAGLLDDLTSSQARKNAKSPFPISIIVPDQYLISLRAHRGATGVGASSSRGKKGKVALLDLNGDSDDEGDGGDSSIPEKEMRALNQLEAVLTKCQKCGTSAHCKIAADGSHVNLTFQQRRAWAIALAHGTNGVTLNTPPKSEQFAMFFKASLLNSAHTSTNAPPQAPPGTPAIGIDATALNSIAATMAGVMMMGGMMGGNMPWGRGVPATPSTQHVQPAPQSSPPQPVVDTTYPTITTFLKDLEAEEMNAGAFHFHNLSQYAEVFEKEDFGYINELAGYTEDQFVKDFGMSRGNARFFHKGLEQKIKSIRRAGRQ